MKHKAARDLAKGDLIISYGRVEKVKRFERRATTVFIRTDHCDHIYALDKIIKIKSSSTL